jgi:hypothetical protein
MALSSELRNRYAEESRLAYISGAALESSVMHSIGGSPGKKLGELFVCCFVVCLRAVCLELFWSHFSSVTVAVIYILNILSSITQTHNNNFVWT